MIRPFTFLCMVGALGSGLYLYQCKHQAQMLDREIARTIKQTEAARDRIGMLRAEWTQLNQPDRVSDLARAHTSLQTAKPTQFVSANDLASKLPAPVAPPPPAPLQPTDVTPEEAPSMVQAEPAPVVVPEKPAAKPSPVPVAEAPARPAEAPRVAEAPRPPAKPDTKPVRQAARPAPAPASVPAPVQVAATPAITRSPLPAPMHTPAHHTVTTEPTAITASVLRAPPARDPVPAQAYVQPVATPAYAPPAYNSAPSYTAPSYSAPAGSVLGGGSRGLPPPVPFAAR